MAAGKFNMQKASGGVASITVADGTTNTAVVLPESGTVATTDNIVGFKNYIINGGFNVNQYPAFSNSSDGYKFDRWLIIGASNIGAAACGNLQNGVDGAITMSNKGLYFTKTGTGDSWISQRIENPTKLSSRTVILSFKAYSPVAMNADVYFDSYNPTNGITTNFGSLKQAFTLLVGWNTYSFTFKLPVIGANYTNIASYLQLNLHMLSGSTTTGAWISDVQLEEGSIATPFENRPYGLELSLCQRYYEKVDTSRCNTNVYGTGTEFEGLVRFKVEKRIVPTILLGSASHWRTMIIHHGVPLSSIGFKETTTSGFCIKGTSSSGNIAAGYAGMIQVNDGYTDNGLDGIFVSAEL